MEMLLRAYRPDTRSDAVLGRNELILKYLPLVRYVLGKLAVYLPTHLDEDDLIGAGVMGLIGAARKFDPKREVQFKTYAIPRIRGAILDELRAQDWVSRSARKKADLLEDTLSSLQEKWDRNPTNEELAEELGVSLDELTKLIKTANFASLISLDAQQASSSEDSESQSMADFIENPKSPEAASVFDLTEEKQVLMNALLTLPKQERLVLTLYYFEDMLLKEIGKVMSISESRVSQIHGKALLSLRARMRRAMYSPPPVVRDN